MDTLVMNYASMSFEELAAHKKDLDAAYADKKAVAQDAFLARFRKEALDLGFDLGDVAGAAQKARRGPGKGGTAPVRYRDPENPENTWSGRGKPRKWLQELIDAGKDKEDYRIKS